MRFGKKHEEVLEDPSRSELFLVFSLPLGHELSAFPPPSGTVSLLSYTKFGKRFVIVPRFLGTPIEFRKMDPRKLNFWFFLVYIRFLVNKWNRGRRGRNNLN